MFSHLSSTSAVRQRQRRRRSIDQPTCPPWLFSSDRFVIHIRCQHAIWADLSLSIRVITWSGGYLAAWLDTCDTQTRNLHNILLVVVTTDGLTDGRRVAGGWWSYPKVKVDFLRILVATIAIVTTIIKHLLGSFCTDTVLLVPINVLWINARSSRPPPPTYIIARKYIVILKCSSHRNWTRPQLFIRQLMILWVNHDWHICGSDCTIDGAFNFRILASTHVRISRYLLRVLIPAILKNRNRLVTANLCNV